VEFALDDRQKEIASLPELLGPEPVSYFTDACRIMSDTTGLGAQTRIAAHLLREIDGRVRDGLQPTLSEEARTAIREAVASATPHAPEGTANKRVQIAVEEWIAPVCAWVTLDQPRRSCGSSLSE
jgi:hypothetical protein